MKGNVTPTECSSLDLSLEEAHRINLLIQGAWDGQEPALSNGRYRSESIYLVINKEVMPLRCRLALVMQESENTSYHYDRIHRKLYSEGEELPFQLLLADRSVKPHYLRQTSEGDHPILNLNPIDACGRGCLFCMRSANGYTPKPSMIRMPMDAYIDSVLADYKMQDLSKFFQIALVTASFRSEASLLAYLTELIVASRNRGFEGEFYIPTHQIVSEEAMETLLQVAGPGHVRYSYTVEVFSNRREIIYDPYRGDPPIYNTGYKALFHAW